MADRDESPLIETGHIEEATFNIRRFEVRGGEVEEVEDEVSVGEDLVEEVREDIDSRAEEELTSLSEGGPDATDVQTEPTGFASVESMTAADAGRAIVEARGLTSGDYNTFVSAMVEEGYSRDEATDAWNDLRATGILDPGSGGGGGDGGGWEQTVHKTLDEVGAPPARIDEWQHESGWEVFIEAFRDGGDWYYRAGTEDDLRRVNTRGEATDHAEEVMENISEAEQGSGGGDADGAPTGGVVDIAGTDIPVGTDIVVIREGDPASERAVEPIGEPVIDGEILLIPISSEPGEEIVSPLPSDITVPFHVVVGRDGIEPGSLEGLYEEYA